MNLKEKYTCKYCKQILNDPITLNCCGDHICKQHILELTSCCSSNVFWCPLCDEKNTNQSLKSNEIIQSMLDIKAYEFEIDPKYEKIFERFKAEIENLEAVLNEPDNFIYEQINELKRQVNLNRESLKSHIDTLADKLIQQLESYENQFRAEYKTNVDMKHYNSLVETSKKQLNEYEKYLSLLSIKAEEKDEKSKKTGTVISKLQSEIKQLKRNLLSNKLITYKPMEISKRELFGSLKIKEFRMRDISGKLKKEFKEYYGFAVLPNTLAAFSNGDFVSGSRNGSIIIWDTNKVKRILTASQQCCINHLIVYDDKCVISASDKNIQIWNVSKGRVELTLDGHYQKVKALKVLENGDLVSASADKTIKIWNKDNGRPIRTLIGHTDEVWALELLDNGDLVSGSCDASIIIWDIPTGKMKMALNGHNDYITRLTLLPNGDLVSGSDDCTIKIWNIEDGTVKRTLKGHNNFISDLKILDNGDLVSGSGDGTIKIWDVENGTFKMDIRVNSEIHALEVLQNGDLISATDKSILILD